MATKKAKTAAPRAPHGTGVGKLMNELLRAGGNNADVLKGVLKKFPKAKTNLSCVSWTRAKLRANGEKLKTNRELTVKKAA